MLLCHQQQKQWMIVQQLNAVGNAHQTPLHVACARNNYLAVMKLLQYTHFINMNATDHVGNTPLHNLCTNIHINNDSILIIKHLLEHQPSMIRKKNNDGKTSFDIIKEKLTFESRFDDQKQHQYLIMIHELFEDYYIEQRWQIHCFLMKYELISQHKMVCCSIICTNLLFVDIFFC